VPELRCHGERGDSELPRRHGLFVLVGDLLQQLQLLGFVHLPPVFRLSRRRFVGGGWLGRCWRRVDKRGGVASLRLDLCAQCFGLVINGAQLLGHPPHGLLQLVKLALQCDRTLQCPF